jgi:hypothetical protein
VWSWFSILFFKIAQNGDHHSEKTIHISHTHCCMPFDTSVMQQIKLFCCSILQLLNSTAFVSMPIKIERCLLCLNMFLMKWGWFPVAPHMLLHNLFLLSQSTAYKDIMISLKMQTIIKTVQRSSWENKIYWFSSLRYKKTMNHCMATNLNYSDMDKVLEQHAGSFRINMVLACL